MYGRILIPLDGSKESERVLTAIRGELDPDGELLLLHVIAPAKTLTVGTHAIPASLREDTARLEALSHLRIVARHGGLDTDQYRAETTIAHSVAQGIVDFARSERVDLIAMYTRDRNGIARIIKSSIASSVRRRSSIEVKVFKPRELATIN